MHCLILLFTCLVIANAEDGGGVPQAGDPTARLSPTSAGLLFLKRHQAADGSWVAATYQSTCTDNPRCEPGAGGPDDTVALTAQATVAFLGAGFDQRTPTKFKDTVGKALTWIIAQQGADGRIGTTIEAHALATLALAEACAMTNEPALRHPAQQAVGALLARRLPGADRLPLAWGDSDAAGTATFDSRITTTCTMALKSALAAGLDVGDGLDRLRVWLDLAWKAGNPHWATLDATMESTFPARWSPAAGATGNDPAAGAADALFLGRRWPDPLLGSLANRVMVTSFPGTTLPADLHSLYLGSMVQFQLGGDPWRTWNKALRGLLASTQRSSADCFNGSWDPTDQTYANHERGRLQSTIYALLPLELYYHYNIDQRKTHP